MSVFGDNHEHEFHLEAPEQLVSDLAALHSRGVQVPPEVDQAVMAEARRQMVGRRRARLIRRWTVSAAAAAAVVVMSFVWNSAQHSNEPAGQQYAEHRDIDGNGHVDILDAFTLARRIDHASASDVTWDMNGDGTMDHKDVNIVASAAVSLEQGTVQ